MPAVYRLREIPPELLEKCRRAAPPPRVPRGYFDSLLTPTRVLLDNGLKLTQAADFFIAQRALKPQLRTSFTNAMKSRMTRFRRREAEKDEVFYWRIALGYARAHAIGNGTISLCGVRGSRWFETNDPANQCKVCRSIVTKLNVTIRN